MSVGAPALVSLRFAETSRASVFGYRPGLERPLVKDVRNLGFGWVNRGAAILDDTIFVGTLDARLLALDARSGVVR